MSAVLDIELENLLENNLDSGLSRQLQKIFEKRIIHIREGRTYGAGEYQTCSLNAAIRVDLAIALAALEESGKIDGCQVDAQFRSLCKVAARNVPSALSGSVTSLERDVRSLRENVLSDVHSLLALRSGLDTLLLPSPVPTLSKRQRQLRRGISLICALDAQIWFGIVSQLLGREYDVVRKLEDREQHAFLFGYKYCCLNSVDLGIDEDESKIISIPNRFGWLKRGFDLVAASLIFLVVLPVGLVISIIMALDSGPLFYGQPRVGQSGRPFRCWKFRTMVPNADKALANILETSEAARAEWAEFEKLREDPRVTGVGKFLRRTSLDELPQLLNVFTGEMSLVGPRPMAIHERERWGVYYHVYKSVRPGVTGPWQIEHRTDSNYNTRIDSLIDYIERWSPWQDIKYLCRTLLVPFKGSGAY